MAYTLLWLCVAQRKALKNRDYAIILIETIILGFAMMERPGLEMWFNFVLLYPLAKVVDKPGTERMLEFVDIDAEDSLGESSDATETKGVVVNSAVCKKKEIYTEADESGKLVCSQEESTIERNVNEPIG